MHQEARFQRNGRSSAFLYRDLDRKFHDFSPSIPKKVKCKLTLRNITKIKIIQESAVSGKRTSKMLMSYGNLLWKNPESTIELADCVAERKDDHTLILNGKFYLGYPKTLENLKSKRDFLQLNIDYQEVINFKDLMPQENPQE